MDRDEARQAVRGSWRQLITGITSPAKQKVNHEQSYICPFCGHGTHGDGLTLNPRSADKNGLKCFSCNFSGDIIDLYQKHTGADYNTALSLLAQEIGITIDTYQKATEGSRRDYKAAADKINARAEEARQKDTEQAAEGTADYTAYYRQCAARLTDPAASAYLQGRGISLKTAQACEVGFDPAADPANAPGATGDEYKPHPCPRIIIPTGRAHYVARSIDPDTPDKYKKLNPNREKGAGSAGLFNRAALYSAHEVFVVEGAFDALAVLEAGGQAVALNSTANAEAFIKQLEEATPEAAFILCLDNDEAGQRAAGTIRDGLQRLQLPFIGWNISGDHKDPNEALTADREAFIKRVKAAQEAAAAPKSDPDGAGDNLTTDAAGTAAEGTEAATTPQEQKQGILTAERARAILEAVDDHYLDMPGFPLLSKMLKLRTHDTVIIAADTGAGKSSLSLNILHELQDRYPALYVNLEMDEATVLQRLIAIHTGIELDQIEGYKHDESTRSKVNAAIEEITARKEIQLITDIYDLKEIEAQIQIATRGRTEPTLVFVDTGLLVTLANKSASRYERFTQISEELRRISRLNNIVLFVLLQQNREGKKEDQKPPTNSSLKESGSWENDATKIIFLWENPQTKGKELVITKARNVNGAGGSIPLAYTPHTQTYKEAKDGFTTLPDGADIPAEWNNAGRRNARKI